MDSLSKIVLTKPLTLVIGRELFLSKKSQRGLLITII